MPSTGLVPNVGEAKMLQGLVNAADPENLMLRLYKNDVTPSSTMTLADYTEATFAGYAAVALSSSNWVITNAGSSVGFASAEYNSGVSFTCSATTSENIYGFYLTEVNSSTLMWSERLSEAPRVITYPNDALAIRPALQLGGSTLRFGLVHYWKVEETSSSRADSYGTGTLTDNNGVTFDVGISGNAAKFVAASSQSLSLANVSLPSSFTADLWYNATTGVETNCALISAGNAWPNDVQLTLYRSGFNLLARVSNGSSGVEAIGALGFGTGHYVNVQITYSTADLIVRIYINTLGVFEAASGASTALSSARRSGPDTLYFGSAGGLYSGDNYDGLLDEPVIWDRVLTTAERAARYSLGVGTFLQQW